MTQEDVVAVFQRKSPLTVADLKQWMREQNMHTKENLERLLAIMKKIAKKLGDGQFELKQK